MKLKDASVDVRFLHPAIVAVLWNITEILRYHLGPEYEFVIISGYDWSHGCGSLHIKHRAIDFCNRYPNGESLDPGEMESAQNDFVLFLGRDFNIVLEEDHWHLEYDPNFL